MSWIYPSVLVLLAALCPYESAFSANKSLAIVLPSPDSVYSERLLLGAQRASHDFEVDLRQRFIASTDDKNIQSSFLKSLIGDKAMGVIIAPSLYPGIGNVIKQSFDLKSVIGVGPVKQEEGQLPTVTSNNLEIGRLAADVIGQQADDKEGNVAWIGYEDSQGVQSERTRSFAQWISKKYSKLKITGIDNKVDNPEVAYIETKNFISSSAEVKGIFTASGEATLGAARAISELKQSRKISLVGVCSTKALATLLDQRVISGLIAPDAYQIGYEAVRLTVARLNGNAVPDVSKVDPTLILSTRQFMQPHDFPPLNTAAYGIVVFPQGRTPDQKDRMKKICEAYYETFPRDSEVSTPIAQQMVTVWPVDSPQSLIQISRKVGDVESCELAVEHYGLTTSLKAIKEAELTTRGMSLDGSGPFLLGWAPSTEKGKKDTLVLVVDLSGATTGEQYLGYFRQWRNNIEQNPAVWNNGWTLDKLRLAIRDWADKTGTMLLPHGLVMKE